MRWPAKDSDEVLDYELDWASERLDAGETILTSEWEVPIGSAVIEASPPPSFSVAGLTLAWISGGDPGETCTVTNRITTTAGRTREFSAHLKIREP